MGAINDMKVSLALLLAFCPAEGSYVCYADDDAFDAAALAAECPEPTMANGANDNANRLTENNREYSQTHSSSFRREQRDRAKGWVPNFYYRTAYGQVSFALASADSGVFLSSSVYPTYRQRENGFAVFQDGQHQGSTVSAPYNTNFGSDGTAECQIPERLGGAGAPRNFCQKMRLFSRMNKDCVWYKGNYYHRKNFPVSELPKDDQGDLVIPSWVYTYFNSHMHHFWRTNLTGLMTPHDPEQFWSHWINGRMPMFSQAHAKWRYAINAAPNCNYKMAYFQNPSATAETSLGGGFTADFIANGFQYSNAAACNVPKPSQWSARFPSLTSTVTSLLGEEKGMKDGVLKNLGWTASGEYTKLGQALLGSSGIWYDSSTGSKFSIYARVMGDSTSNLWRTVSNTIYLSSVGPSGSSSVSLLPASQDLPFHGGAGGVGRFFQVGAGIHGFDGAAGFLCANSYSPCPDPQSDIGNYTINPGDYWGYASAYFRSAIAPRANGLLPIKPYTYFSKEMQAADRYQTGYVAIGPMNKASQFTVGSTSSGV